MIIGLVFSSDDNFEDNSASASISHKKSLKESYGSVSMDSKPPKQKNNTGKEEEKVFHKQDTLGVGNQE